MANGLDGTYVYQHLYEINKSIYLSIPLGSRGGLLADVEFCADAPVYTLSWNRKARRKPLS